MQRSGLWCVQALFPRIPKRYLSEVPFSLYPSTTSLLYKCPSSTSSLPTSCTKPVICMASNRGIKTARERVHGSTSSSRIRHPSSPLHRHFASSSLAIKSSTMVPTYLTDDYRLCQSSQLGEAIDACNSETFIPRLLQAGFPLVAFYDLQLTQ